MSAVWFSRIQSLKDELEQKSDELKDLTEKYLALLPQVDANTNLQALFDTHKYLSTFNDFLNSSLIYIFFRQENETRLADYQNQIEHLNRERASLLDEMQKSSASPLPSADTDKQTKVAMKLKRALQTFREKINRLVTDRPDLFTNIGEETSERLDHLISTLEHQATQMELLQTERNEMEAQLKNEIQELQG